MISCDKSSTTPTSNTEEENDSGGTDGGEEASCPEDVEVCLTLSDGNLNYDSTVDIAGFQFNHNGCVINVSGGDATINGFSISSSSTAVIAFSLSGDVIPQGVGTLIELDGDILEDCLFDFIFSGLNGDALDVSFAGTDFEEDISNSYKLSTCNSSIGSNVPEFFQKYFQCVDIQLSESGNYINIYYNGLPPYESWYYDSNDPNNIGWESQGEGSFLIENAYILEMDYVISIPVNPIPRSDDDSDFAICGQGEGCPDEVDGELTANGVTHEYPMGSVGVALNGVNIFNPCAAPPDIIEDEAASFDLYSGHPAGSSGIYHYHTTSKGPLEVLNSKGLVSEQNTTPGDGEIEIYGIMCDGTVILGCTELDGSSPNSSDWDAQNGHIHDLVDETGTILLENRYHTHICYSEITDIDTDGNGFQEHEFTPEISYYKTPGMGESFDRCAAMSVPIEPDN